VASGARTHRRLDYKRVNGGLLVQDRDNGMITESDLKVVTKRVPTEAGNARSDLRLESGQVRQVECHCLCQGRQTIGVGAGQMSRINSARIAAIKAEHAGLAVPAR
jgi:phosphoribosylaminoimidazolecarboxamide formyltransferase / IMP cyclohydrolase